MRLCFLCRPRQAAVEQRGYATFNRIKYLVMSPRRGSTPRQTDWLTVSRKVTLTLTEWSRVPRDSNPRKTALARASSIYERQTRPLVRKGAPQKQDRNSQGDGTQHQDLLTDRQSQCNFDFDLTELVQRQLRVSRKLEEWVQKNF
jgi:hypothetical protein